MRELAIDIETYSNTDLTTCGVYKYAEDPSFKVLLFAYAIDGGEVQVLDLVESEGRLPDIIKEALIDENVTKTAFNATFERVCLTRHLRDVYGYEPRGTMKFLDPSQWRCTMVASAMAGLPLSLGQCGEVLRLSEGKMTEGKALIKKFSCPNKKGERAMPSDDPEGWETFKAYCKRDVEVEQSIRRKVTLFTQPEWEQKLYTVDQSINDRGVLIDRQLVESADRMNDEYIAELMEKAKTLTGLENPNSPTQLKQWLADNAHLSVASLNKKSIEDVENAVGKYSVAYKVLQLRREMGKTSNKKYGAMLNCVCEDGRIHGLLQYYGAARTGRWAGRLVQVQNLPQNHLKDIDTARALAKDGDLDEFGCNYSNVTQTLSELIRTSFVAPEGKTFHVCDFSAIEARVIAWVAGEQWVLNVFKDNGDIYCETASQMFKVPVEKHGRNAELRQKGKIAVLGLGYGGGVGALKTMGGDRMGLTEREMREIVDKWRNANPNIVRLWSNVERGARRTILTGQDTRINRDITFRKEFVCLTVELPSRRKLVYPRVKVDTVVKTFGGEEGRESEAIVFEGIDQTTKKWGKVETYGGKMTENIVQAIARDILAMIMFRATAKDFEIVFHVHDEIIVEADGSVSLNDVEGIFSEELEWAKGLPLKGAGYTTPYYLKD